MYRPEIDGIRAVAVGLVVLYHAHVPGFSGGFVGVDAFFVLSGFLIASTISDRLERGTFTLRGFWTRRVRRLLPNLLLVTAACLVGGWLVLMPNDLQDLARASVAQTGFLANVYFWLKAGYFDTPALTKPLLHLWSLSVEEQFYVALPLVLLALQRTARTRLFLLGSMAAVLSLTASIWACSAAPTAGFYLLPFRAWELLIGVGLARQTWRLPSIAAPLGLLALLGSALIFTDQTAFPGVAALVPCLGTAGVLMARRGPATDVLSLSPMVLLGRASYALYLWHWPALAFTRYVLGPDLSAPVTLVVLGFSAGVALLTWRLVEEPLRRGHGIWSAKAVLMGAAGTTVLLGAVSLAIDRQRGAPWRLGDQARHAYDEAFATLDFDEPCLDGPDLGAPTVCANTDEVPEVVVWGDSHARALMPAVLASGARTLRVQCVPLLEVYDTANDVSLADSICAAANRELFKYLMTNQVRTVVLSAAWSSHVEGREFRMQGAGQRDALYADAVSDDPHEVFARALPATVGALRATGAEVVLVAQVPQHEAWVANELARAITYGNPTSLTRPVSEHRARQRFVHSVLAAAAESEGVHLFDPASVLCTPDCRASQGGVALYYDHHHLTLAGAALLAPGLASYWK